MYKRQEYLLNVKASDNGSPRLSSSVSVRVLIYGAGDNSPEFQFKFYNATVSENVSKGSEVLQVNAVPQVSGQNVQPYYCITAGNDDRKFRINSKTG